MSQGLHCWKLSHIQKGFPLPFHSLVESKLWSFCKVAAWEELSTPQSWHSLHDHPLELSQFSHQWSQWSLLVVCIWVCHLCHLGAVISYGFQDFFQDFSSQAVWERRGFHGPCCQPLSSVQFSRSVVSDSLRPHGLQHARPYSVWGFQLYLAGGIGGNTLTLSSCKRKILKFCISLPHTRPTLLTKQGRCKERTRMNVYWPYGFWSQTNEFSLDSSSGNDLLFDLLKLPFYIYKMITPLH